MGAKTLEPLAVVPAKSAKLNHMMHDAERPLDVEPHMALGHLQKYMAERAALVSAHHHRELAAAQARIAIRRGSNSAAWSPHQTHSACFACTFVSPP